jgi:hypothetical protein
MRGVYVIGQVVTRQSVIGCGGRWDRIAVAIPTPPICQPTRSDNHNLPDLLATYALHIIVDQVGADLHIDIWRRFACCHRLPRREIERLHPLHSRCGCDDRSVGRDRRRFLDCEATLCQERDLLITVRYCNLRPEPSKGCCANGLNINSVISNCDTEPA